MLRLEELPGYRFDIDTSELGYGQLLQGFNNAFDGLSRLVVGQTQYSSSGSPALANDRQAATTPTVSIDNLNVHREIFVPSNGRESFVRTVDVVENPTKKAITTTVTIVGNLGSDGATQVFATSSGNTAAEATDHWVGTDDADGSGAPAIVHYIHTCGLSPTSVQVVEDNIIWTYKDVTIGAGETINLAHLTILAPTRADAIAAAGNLVASNGLFQGLATDSLPGTLANFVANKPPVADSTFASGSKNADVVGTLAAFDAEVGDKLTYILVSDPSNGTVAFTGNQFKYSPNPNFTGTDSFEFKVNDGCADSNVATVSILVSAVNLPPVASDASLLGFEDTPIVDVMTASDSDSLTLTYTIVTGPSNGRVVLVGSGPQFTYTPAVNYNGADSFTFKANDGSLDFEHRDLQHRSGGKQCSIPPQRRSRRSIDTGGYALGIPRRIDWGRSRQRDDDRCGHTDTLGYQRNGQHSGQRRSHGDWQ